MSEFTWRAMTLADISDVVSVAGTAFPEHFEQRACFENRLALFPQGCFVLSFRNRVEGYLIAYPSAFGAIPPLNSMLGSLPELSETIYLHDLALGAAVRGQGHARPIVERLVRAGRELGASRIALVSVNGSVPFWQGMGFVPVRDDLTLLDKLLTYGDSAAYMIREIYAATAVKANVPPLRLRP